MTDKKTFGDVTIEVNGPVADVKLNRPDKLNALSQALLQGLIDAAAWINETPKIRCVVLSGEGKGFCAGLDMQSFSNPSQSKMTDLNMRTHGIANFFQQAIWGWRECKVPVIAAIQGVAVGGGFQIALGADIRIVHPASKMSVMEMKWGLIPDMGGTALMCHLASEDIVRELTYTARIFDGIAAKDYGFATHLSETPVQEAMTLAQEIASNNPEAVIAAKTLFNDVADFRAADILKRESQLQMEIVMRPNQIEAIKATFEKRPADFKDAK